MPALYINAFSAANTSKIWPLINLYPSSIPALVFVILWYHL
jgi:hypothetical protein